MFKKVTTALVLGLLVGPSLPQIAQAQSAVTEQEAQAIALDAYIYFYPLMSMDLSRKQFTNGTNDFKGPMNTFVNVPAYPPADFKGVVRSNFDTLYSVSWLDMTKEPVVISAPDTDGRYYLLPMLDMWTDVFASAGLANDGHQGREFSGDAPELDRNGSGRNDTHQTRRRPMFGSSAEPRPTARLIMMRSAKFRRATKSRFFRILANRPSRSSSNLIPASI